MLGQISDPHCVAWSLLVSVSVVTMVICHNSYNGQNKVAIIVVVIAIILFFIIIFFVFETYSLYLVLAVLEITI